MQLLIAIAGGAIGGLVAFIAHRWRFWADRWSDVADELCENVVELANMSAEFWLVERNPTDESASKEAAFTEVRIRGALERLNALRLPFADWCTMDDTRRFSENYTAFADEITGGSFTARRRPPDPERAFAVHAAAADLVVTIKSCLRRGVQIRSSFERWLTRGAMR